MCGASSLSSYTGNHDNHMGSIDSRGTWFSRWTQTLVTADIAFSVALVVGRSQRDSLSDITRLSIGRASIRKVIHFKTCLKAGVTTKLTNARLREILCATLCHHSNPIHSSLLRSYKWYFTFNQTAGVLEGNGFQIYFWNVQYCSDIDSISGWISKINRTVSLSIISYYTEASK